MWNEIDVFAVIRNLHVSAWTVMLVVESCTRSFLWALRLGLFTSPLLLSLTPGFCDFVKFELRLCICVTSRRSLGVNGCLACTF